MREPPTYSIRVHRVLHWHLGDRLFVLLSSSLAAEYRALFDSSPQAFNFLVAFRTIVNGTALALQPIIPRHVLGGQESLLG